MRNAKLFWLNGEIRSLFDAEVDRRVRLEYSARAEREITRNMLTDTDAALAYLKRLDAIEREVMAEIENALGEPVEVGFEPTHSPSGIVQNFNTLLGISHQGEMQTVEQFRRVVQMFAGSLSDESALEVASIYDAWQIGKAYAAGEFVKYGTNGVGDAQLYKVVSAHTSQADWTPDAAPTLYTPIGLNDSGYPVWSKPTGGHDAYDRDDVVDYNGTLYKSTVDGNVWSPDEYPQGWQIVNRD